MKRKLYQDEKVRFWQAIFGFSLIIFLIIGTLGMSWSYQKILRLEDKLTTARSAILSSGQNLRNERKTRLALEKQLQTAQSQLLKIKRQKPETAIIKSQQKTIKKSRLKKQENNPFIPSYEEQKSTEKLSNTEAVREFLPNSSLNSSYVLFRGKCIGCE